MWYKRIVLLILVCGALSPFYSQAQKKNKNNSAEPAKPKKDSVAKNSIAEKVKTCKKMDGLFTLYQDTTNSSTYILIKKEQLGKEFIYFCYTENGLVETGHFRGNFRDNKIVKLRKYFDKIEWVTQNTNYYFNPESKLSKAADANISPAILSSQKIVASDSAKGEYLLDANGLFLSESLHQVKPSPPPPSFSRPNMFSLGMLSREKTKYVNVRSYPQNTDVVVEYVYDLPEPINYGSGAVTDARTIAIVLQHSFLEVPQNNFKARFDDPRVGFFASEVTDLTSTHVAPYRDVISRWHLEKKDPNAQISEPVEPITFWIENTTPPEFRETIRNGILSWNEAFEQAGFRNAIVVQEQPDNATWDAGDVRYNVIRWTSSPLPPFGGYGPSFVNPRTGQILGADIMLEFVYVTNRLHSQNFFDKACLGSEEIFEHAKRDKHFCAAGLHMHNSMLLGSYLLDAENRIDINKNDFIQQALKELVLHEVGHTLGLSHNMKASQLYSPDQLNDKSLTGSTGLVGSVMDYVTVNIASDPQKQGDYFIHKPGIYDKWAIEYGYSTALNDPESEKKRLEKILERSTSPSLAFGNDADDMRMAGFGIDPRVMIDDLSSDAIGYSVDRIKICNKIVEKLKDKYRTPGKTYQELYNGYLIATSNISWAASIISRYIGGVYVERSLNGQQNEKIPYTPVSYADQRRAMQGLSQYIFSPDAFKAPADLYNYLQQQRRGFNFFGNNEDPHVHDRVLNIQRSVLNQLLHPNVLKRLTDSKLYGNQYSLTECMNDLTNAIFQADARQLPNTFRQNLQVEYVKRLIAITGLPKGISNYDNISQAVAFDNLNQVKRLLQGPSTGDAATHRNFLLFLIQQALESN